MTLTAQKWLEGRWVAPGEFTLTGALDALQDGMTLADAEARVGYSNVHTLIGYGRLRVEIAGDGGLNTIHKTGA